MSWFKRKPNEDELERSILFAAMLARAKERETRQLISDDEIRELLRHSFKDIGVKAGRAETQIAVIGVQALLTEGEFINEALDFRLENGGAPMPVSFRGKMLDAMQASVDDFVSHDRRR